MLQGGPAFSSLQHGRVAGVAFSKLMMSDNIGCGLEYTLLTHACVCLRCTSHNSRLTAGGDTLQLAASAVDCAVNGLARAMATSLRR